MLAAAPVSRADSLPLLRGRRVVVLGSGAGLGLAVARAAEAAGAEVLGVDAEARFDHLSALYRADPSDPAALDAVGAALPGGIDGLALMPLPARGDSPRDALISGLLAPKRLAEALVPKLAEGASIVARAAPPHASWSAALAEVRAAAALGWDDLDGFVSRWNLAAEPARAPRLAGWGMLAWVLAHRWSWAGRGIRVNALTTAEPDGRMTLPVAAKLGLGAGEGADVAAGVAAFLLSPLSRGLTGANIAADGGLSAQVQTSLEGL